MGLGPEQDVAQLEGEVVAFRGRLAPAAVEQAVGTALEQVTAQYTVNGVSTVSEDTLAKYEDTTRQQYDDRLRADALKLEADIDGASHGLGEVLAVAAELRDPVTVAANSSGAETLIETRKVRALLELQRAESRLVGKSPSSVLKLYEMADDASALRYVVESQARAGWPDVKMDTSDAAGLFALQRAIIKAQRARVEAAVPALVDASKRIEKLRGSATLQALWQHLKSGRGIARVPRPRHVKIAR